MKRMIIPILCCVVLLFPTAALAHSGKTDANGGHYNHSTGQYHYHHGYSAHQHENGVCPYDYESKSSYVSASSHVTSYVVTHNIDSTNQVEYQTEVKIQTPQWVKWLIAVLVATIVIMFFVIKNKNECIIEKNNCIDEQKEQRKKERKETQESLQSFVDDLSKKYGKRFLYTLSDAPNDASVNSKNLPCSNIPGENEYIFFCSSLNSNQPIRYHKTGCRYGVLPVNAYDIIEGNRNYAPCRICKPVLPNVNWVKKYRKHKDFLDKNNVKV